MGKFGINVPPGVPAFSVDEVTKAAKAMADESGEVGSAGRHVMVAI
jgi:succinyl-CoA synthetase beta subunit